MWALLASLFLVAQAEVVTPDDCWHVMRDSTCWAEVRRLYDAPPIGVFAQAGVQVRRVFLQDGGQDMRVRFGYDGSQAGLLSAERGPDGIAWLSFRPAPLAGSANRPLRVRLTEAGWREIEPIADGMASNPPANGWEICFDSWNFLAEVAGPAGRVARYRECLGGAASTLADRMARLAIAGIRHCGPRLSGRGRLDLRIRWLNRCSRRADRTGARR